MWGKMELRCRHIPLRPHPWPFALPLVSFHFTFGGAPCHRETTAPNCPHNCHAPTDAERRLWSLFGQCRAIASASCADARLRPVISSLLIGGGGGWGEGGCGGTEAQRRLGGCGERASESACLGTSSGLKCGPNVKIPRHRRCIPQNHQRVISVGVPPAPQKPLPSPVGASAPTRPVGGTFGGGGGDGRRGALRDAQATPPSHPRAAGVLPCRTVAATSHRQFRNTVDPPPQKKNKRPLRTFAVRSAASKWRENEGCSAWDMAE